MDYEKKYREALERARELVGKWIGKNKNFYIEDYSYIFPELNESEDERIRKFIIHELACLRASEETDSDRYEELTNSIAWLEKQSERRETDYNSAKKEPEFKPFDKVLVRDGIDDIWRLAQYGFESKDNTYNTVGGTWWAYCIPYEGNEHLLGTTENRE